MSHPMSAMARWHSWLSLPMRAFAWDPQVVAGSWRYITQFWYIIFQTARSKLTHAQDVLGRACWLWTRRRRFTGPHPRRQLRDPWMNAGHNKMAPNIGAIIQR